MSSIDSAGEGPTARDDAADQELVLRSRSGDRAAFAELWRRHYRAGISVARSMTSSLDADDLVQEAYASIYQSILRGGGPTGSFRAYLFTSIRNTAAGWGRARKETTTDDLETIEDPATSDRAAEEALDRSITVRAFRSLPSRWQEALWYSEIEGMKPAEVAPLLGMKPTAVAQLTFRAREGLREAWIQAHLKTVANGSDCQWTIERLGAFARSNLCRRDQARAEAHLAECTRCAIVASEAKDVSRRLTLVLLPLTVGVTGTAAYLATIQGGGSSLVALAAMPSGVVQGTVAVHGGAGLAVAGAGLGATGSGVATAGAAGVGTAGVAAAGAAGTVVGTAAATAGAATAVAAGAASGGLLSAIGSSISILVTGAVLLSSAASGVMLPSIPPTPPAATEVAADRLSTGAPFEEADASATGVTDETDPSDPTLPEDAAGTDEVAAVHAEASGDDITGLDTSGGPDAAFADAAASGTASEAGDEAANGTATGGTTGTATASTTGTGHGTANGTANVTGTANGTANVTGPGNGTGPGTGTGTGTGSTNGTATGSADGNVRGNGSHPDVGKRQEAPALPAGVPASNVAASATDRGGPAVGPPTSGAPSAVVRPAVGERGAP